ATRQSGRRWLGRSDDGPTLELEVLVAPQARLRNLVGPADARQARRKAVPGVADRGPGVGQQRIGHRGEPQDGRDRFTGWISSSRGKRWTNWGDPGQQVTKIPGGRPREIAETPEPETLGVGDTKRGVVEPRVSICWWTILDSNQ